MKVVDIERVVILMRFIQYGWDEERKKRFDDNLRMMLETQCEDLENHDKQIRVDTIEECVEAINKLNIEYAYPHTICNVLEQLKSQDNMK